MKIEDIVGKGKLLEPPFTITDDEDGYGVLHDAKGTVILSETNIYLQPGIPLDYETAVVKHICELLNERWK